MTPAAEFRAALAAIVMAESDRTRLAGLVMAYGALMFASGQQHPIVPGPLV